MMYIWCNSIGFNLTDETRMYINIEMHSCVPITEIEEDQEGKEQEILGW